MCRINIISIVKHNLPKIKKLFRKYRVERAYLFGSAATGRFNENSDIDFLFSFPQ
ncbi:nucleotidyltransferase domain-containing protein, partial [uncultured Flavobacterium sp.]|uniref:nucleotidyltransferase family protein n=1 Tax=uncultured Flavobacterium sp. TaxID=165435 RepID=UPI003452D996